MKNVFDTLWEEQLCRIHVEQDIFQSQVRSCIFFFAVLLKRPRGISFFYYFTFQANEIISLRAEVKHLTAVAHQLEPYIKSFSAAQMTSSNKIQESKSLQQNQEFTSLHSQQLQTLLDHINSLQLDRNKFHSQSNISSASSKTSAKGIHDK